MSKRSVSQTFRGFVLLTLTVVFQSTPAYNESNTFLPKGVANNSCKQFLSDYSLSGLERTQNGYKWDVRFGRYIGFLEGFQTQANHWNAGKYDFFESDDAMDSFGWIGTWCREKPDASFYEAVRAYTNSKVFEVKPSGTGLSLIPELLSRQPKTDTPVDEELGRCQSLFESNSLTTGGAGNAYDCYRSILARHPGNQEALSGIEKIYLKYREWFEAAVKDGDHEKAASYMKKMELVSTDEVRLATARDRLNSLRAAIEEEERLDEQRNRRQEAEARRGQFEEASRLLAQMSGMSPSARLARLPHRLAYLLTSCYVGTSNQNTLSYALSLAKNDDYMASNIIDIAATGGCNPDDSIGGTLSRD